MSKTSKRFLLALLTCATIGLASSQAHVAPSTFPPLPWAFLSWDKDVGRILGQEADSEGPKSFAVTPEGGVLLLDQVNRRILDLDAKGALAATIPLSSDRYDDIEQWDGRTIFLLDRLHTKSLVVLDRKGAEVAKVAVEGRGIEHSGLITALLPRPEGVWLEVQHRYSVKVLDRHFAPCDRQIVLGRPVADGKSFQIALDGRGGVTLSTSRRNERFPAPGVSLRGKEPIHRIVWTDVDATGRVHTVLHEAAFSPVSPFRVQSERYWLVVLNEQLQEIARTESPWVLTLYDQRVEFRLGQDGRLWQMAFTAEGVRIVDWGRRVP